MHKTSEHIGECPSSLCTMLFDIINKKPFMISFDTRSFSMHIFKILDWSKDKNIKFEYIADNTHIVMYSYCFKEN